MVMATARCRGDVENEVFLAQLVNHGERRALFHWRPERRLGEAGAMVLWTPGYVTAQCMACHVDPSWTQRTLDLVVRHP